MESTTAELTKATADLASVTTRANRLTEERDKVTKERNDAQADLEAYRLTGLKPRAVPGDEQELQEICKPRLMLPEEKKLLGQKITRLQTELDR